MKTLSLTLTAAVLYEVASSALAGPSESAAYCDLTRNEATVRSTLLGSSETFASVAPTQANRSALQIGIRKSIRGMRQAGLVNEIAEADCDVYESQHKVDSALAGLEARIERQVQTARKAVLEQALVRAEENLAFERKALAAHVATWADVRAALDTRDAIVQTLGTLDQSLVRLNAVPDDGTINVQQALGQSVDAQVRATSLRSRLDATAAWDLRLEVGIMRELGTDTQRPYVGFFLSHSLGASSAIETAKKTRQLAVEYVRSQEQGGTQSLDRKVTEMRGLYDNQSTALAGLSQRLSLLAMARDQVTKVSTVAALRMRRNLATEILQVQAEKVAVETRKQLLGAWLTEQGKTLN